MNDEMQRIIIRREGKDFGPYTRDEATLYLKKGQLFHSDTARLEDGDSWRCLGTILGVSAPPPPPAHPPSALPAVQSDATTLQSAPNEELIRVFVGQNYEYYARKWSVLEANPKRLISWNWAAFFLGLGWMFYRKMYLFGWITIGAVCLMLLFDAISDTTLFRQIDFLVALMCGIQGNNLYRQHCQRKLRDIAPSGMADEATRVQLARAGGTNIAAGIIFPAIWLILIVLALLG